MVRHIIIWDFDERLNETEKKTQAEIIKKGLEGLKGIVPGLKEIKVHTELLSSSNGDIMLDSVFESREALAGYQTHPEHLKVAAVVKSVTSHRSCADIEI